ncbi:MAG: hypothetical protein GY789_22485 [Hyphomicrobiales bacterium]|nr:hypothetical protein [Hyphomicrobiales bacterium]MCP4998345.1 hypothetical protein [Hyphomicrobiales bacterium]
MTATSVTKAVTLFALIALLIAGCGRKGDLEIPSSKPAVENQDGTEEEAEEDRPFILDALIK